MRAHVLLNWVSLPDQVWYLIEEERASCFNFIVFWMSCYCKCSVALPYGAMCWPALSDCEIS